MACTEPIPSSNPQTVTYSAKSSSGGAGGGSGSLIGLGSPILFNGANIPKSCPSVAPVVDPQIPTKEAAGGTPPCEQFVLLREVDATYQVLDEVSYLGTTVATESTTVETVIGSPPTVECLDPDDPGGAFAEGSAIEASVTAPALEEKHLHRRIVTSVPWAETPAELVVVGESIIKESAAVPITFTSPANFLVREGRKYHLTYPQLGIDHDIVIDGVTWSGDPTTDRGVLATIDARLYLHV